MISELTGTFKVNHKTCSSNTFVASYIFTLKHRDQSDSDNVFNIPLRDLTIKNHRK